MSLEQDGILREYRNYIENYLKNDCFVYPEEPQQLLFEAMRYSLLAGGKRLRPVFVFDFCKMCGGNWKKAAPFAAAVEMVHTYSLIHDDLPCMDNDDYRRGRLTNHKVYGEAMAVLAGDALLTGAFSTLAAADFASEKRIQAVKILSRCAGELGMVGGQVLDMLSESRECTPQEVENIHIRKTAALIQAACCLGVLAGGGTEAQMEGAKTFARCLGLAFQIRDDILDVIGNAGDLGKAVGMDKNKNTFVQLHGVQACQEMVCAYSKKAEEALSAFPNHDFMASLCRELIDRNH